MLSLYVKPLTFDNKKNEILKSAYNIEWKKQVSTVSLKKGLSIPEFFNQKINGKLNINAKPTVFAYFDYIEENNKKMQIYLVSIDTTNASTTTAANTTAASIIKIYTNLYYNSHIPSKDNINIVNNSNIKKYKTYLKITGDVVAFCIDINTYYLEEININEYIEFVQNDEYENNSDNSGVDSYDEYDINTLLDNSGTGLDNNIKNKNGKDANANCNNADDNTDKNINIEESYSDTTDNMQKSLALDKNNKNNNNNNNDNDDINNNDNDNDNDNNDDNDDDDDIDNDDIDNDDINIDNDDINIDNDDNDIDNDDEDDDEDNDDDDDDDDDEDDEEDEEIIDVDPDAIDPDIDPDADADADADADEDIDIDIDAETDMDAETEGDVETEGDAETEGDDIDAAEVEEIDDVEPSEVIDIKPVERNTRKKKSNNKNIKLSNNIDLSIIFDILKPEDKTTITPENQLHPTRKLNLDILKTLKLPFKIVQIIEKGIFNYSIDKCNFKSFIPLWDNSEFIEIYISKTKNIYSNLNSNSYVKNIKLIEKIKLGHIQPYDLAFLDTYKLFPEIWTEIIEEKTKIEKILKESLIETATDIFECPRCHKRKTIYCEVQTRSSDEPMTKFITCLECGCKWKKY